jgi:hypothetical protein
MTFRLLGELAGHARGKTLIAALGAEGGDLPPHGVTLAFGKEAQRSPELLRAWVQWAQDPGRVLVLLPPFQQEVCQDPTRWEARHVDPLAGGETELGRVLARDRRHELRGELIPLERVGGQVVTAFWRRHPAAGMVVITALPLWSLLVLDHRRPLQDWVEDLVKLAGSPRQVATPPASGPTNFSPGPDDWTLLLHLCTGPFVDAEGALAALAGSSIHRLDHERASQAFGRCHIAGFVSGGSLTQAGEALLLAGPFSAHTRALRRMSHV